VDLLTLNERAYQAYCPEEFCSFGSYQRYVPPVAITAGLSVGADDRGAEKMVGYARELAV